MSCDFEVGAYARMSLPLACIVLRLQGDMYSYLMLYEILFIGERERANLILRMARFLLYRARRAIYAICACPSYTCYSVNLKSGRVELSVTT